MDLNNKLALVTGSSRGLGRATALALAREGANVLINYLSRADKATEVVSAIREMGRESEAFRADVSDSRSVFQMADSIWAKYGSLDILVNNAGTIIRPGNWDVLEGAELGRTIDINLKGAIYCLQAFVPKMKEQQSGRIINVTSTYAITGATAVMAYTCAKAGIISLTYAMARELGQFGITVNAVAPGNFDTDLAKTSGDAVNEWAISTTPLGRLGHPEEIGEAVVYLAKADFVTGHVLVVDGGQLLNM
jgi:3-oxoacyl-[acyl-carrier protein] reductase